MSNDVILPSCYFEYLGHMALENRGTRWLKLVSGQDACSVSLDHDALDFQPLDHGEKALGGSDA